MKNERHITNGTFFNGWSLSVFLLSIIIIAGGVFIYIKSHDSPGVEIYLAPEKAIVGQIYINGGINNPGIYPLYAGDTLDDVVKAAGGSKDGADLSTLQLSVVPAAGENLTQKIDINKAEAWLLNALPGVGEARAEAIISYRERNGLFRDVKELLNVPGFGDTVFDRIKDFITVHE